MSHPYQNHFTIVIGEPNEKLKPEVAEHTSGHNLTEEEAWIGYASQIFDLITAQNKTANQSAIELLLSSMLEEEVQVANPYLGFTMNKGCSFPVIIFYEDYIQDFSGNPIPMTRFNDFMLEYIGDYFQEMLQCDWHHISLTTKIA